MSNIQAPSGLKAPTLQTSGKQDGQGNGSGGMYFGGGHQEDPQDQFYSSSYRYYGDADTKDIPFFTPIFGFVSQALDTWKTAVAKIFYKDYVKHQ